MCIRDRYICSIYVLFFAIFVTFSYISTTFDLKIGFLDLKTLGSFKKSYVKNPRQVGTKIYEETEIRKKLANTIWRALWFQEGRGWSGCVRENQAGARTAEKTKKRRNRKMVTKRPYNGRQEPRKKLQRAVAKSYVVWCTKIYKIYKKCTNIYKILFFV